MNKSPAFMRFYNKSQDSNGWDDFLGQHMALWSRRSPESGIQVDNNNVSDDKILLKILTKAKGKPSISWWNSLDTHIYNHSLNELRGPLNDSDIYLTTRPYIATCEI